MKKSKNVYMQNRELSWLKFDERVMDEAVDPTVPLLERLRFLTIFTTNLDEFFMVRVGSLIDMLPLGADGSDNKTGMTPQEQLDAIYTEARRLYKKRDELFNRLVGELRTQDIYYLKYDELTPSEQEYAENYFSHEIMPLLSPQIIDKLHPFPQLQNKTIAIGVLLKNGTKSRFRPFSLCHPLFRMFSIFRETASASSPPVIFCSNLRTSPSRLTKFWRRQNSALPETRTFTQRMKTWSSPATSAI